MSAEVDAFLEHHGVKGMKWGVTRADGGSGGSSGPSRREKRKAKNQEIQDARTRQYERGLDLQKQAFKTYAASGEKAAKAAINKYNKMEADMLTHPDAATAAKMTTGEKWAVGIAWGGITVSAVGLAAMKIKG